MPHLALGPVCVPHSEEAQEDGKRVRKVTETGTTFMASPDPFIRSKDGIWGLAMVQHNPREREIQFYEFSDFGFLCRGFLLQGGRRRGDCASQGPGPKQAAKRCQDSAVLTAIEGHVIARGVQGLPAAGGAPWRGPRIRIGT